MSSTTIIKAGKQLTIDLAQMLAAISGIEGEEERCAGFLNRQTGEIEFVWDSEGNALDDAGTDAAIDSYLARKMVAANPDVWIAIPKYDLLVEDPNFFVDVAAGEAEKALLDKEEKFYERFFREHGLKAKLV